MGKPHLNLPFRFLDFFPWNHEDMKILNLGFFPNINQFSYVSLQGMTDSKNISSVDVFKNIFNFHFLMSVWSLTNIKKEDNFFYALFEYIYWSWVISFVLDISTESTKFGSNEGQQETHCLVGKKSEFHGTNLWNKPV